MRCVTGVAGFPQIVVQIRFLLGQTESQPLREYLVVAAAQHAVGVLAAQHAQKIVVAIPARGQVPQRGEENQLTEVSRDPRQCSPPDLGCRRPRRLRIGRRMAQFLLL